MYSWEEIQNYESHDATCIINGTKSRVKITDVNILPDGSRWFSLSFYENHHLTPSIFGHNLGKCNVLYSPEKKRSYRGFRSEEILNTLEIIQ